MKILVTGALGFIGSHFVEAAEKIGHQVCALDALTYAGRTANLPWACRWHRCDISDQVLVEHHLRTFRPDWVINLAAESHVANSIGKRGPFLQSNVIGTQSLLDACLAYWRELKEYGPKAGLENFRVVCVSTDEVYGSLGPNDAPWTAMSPYAPNNPYAASKAAADHLARAYHETFGLPVIVTHSSNNYGTRQHPEKLIPTLIGQCIKREPMTLHGDGRNIRDWLHVDDHCAGLLAVLKKGRPGTVYNFGGQCERTNREIAELVGAEVARQIGRPESEIVYVADRPGNDRRYSVDVKATTLALAWIPGSPIEVSIDEIVRWHLENPKYELTYGR